MKRIWLLLILLVAGASLPLRAQGPDDTYVQVYQLIQDGDRIRASGQTAQARIIYLEAYDKLARLQTAYPRWNDSVVQFRLNDLVDKLRSLPAEAAPPSQNPANRGSGTSRPLAPSSGAPSLPAVPPVQPLSPDAENRIRALQEQVQRLSDENAILQVKLTEALSARAASVDPQELRKAEQRILALEKEKEILGAALEKARGTPLTAAANSAALEEALKSSRAELAKQLELVNQLMREKEVLEVRLRDALRLQAGPAAPAPLPQTPALPASKETAQPAPPPKSAPPPNPDTAPRLQAEVAGLSLEQQRLEANQKEIQAKLAGRGLGGADAGTSATMPGPVRDDLLRQLNAATRDLIDNQARLEATDKELAALKTPVRVIESERIPYTPEELALFKPPELDFAKTNRARVRSAIREYPVRDQKLLDQATVDLQARRYPEAERSLTEILRTDGANVEVLGDLAIAQVSQRRFAEAETTLTRAFNLDPTSPRTLRLLGGINYDQKKFDAALDYFNRATHLDPLDPVGLHYLGITLAQKGQRRAAETSIRRAIEVAPNYADAHYQLAVIYADQQPPFAELARWHYQKAIGLGYPENPDLEKKIEQVTEPKAAPSSAAKP